LELLVPEKNPQVSLPIDPMGMSKRSLPASSTRLAVLQPVGEVFVNGLASSYDDDFPVDSPLEAYVTREEFAKAMTKINEALLDHWPCLPCTSFAYGCCVCTLGLSFYCATSQVQEAESRVQLQLRRINAQSNFAGRGVEWRLVRKWYRRASWVEIWHVEQGSAAAVTQEGGAAAAATHVDNGVGEDGERGSSALDTIAAQDETMTDRVV
jgi:hypothetical protein